VVFLVLGFFLFFFLVLWVFVEKFVSGGPISFPATPSLIPYLFPFAPHGFHGAVLDDPSSPQAEPRSPVLYDSSSFVAPASGSRQKSARLVSRACLILFSFANPYGSSSSLASPSPRPCSPFPDQRFTTIPVQPVTAPLKNPLFFP